MADLPQGIDLPRHRDFEGRRTGQWLRHGFLVLLSAFVVAALLNAFGARTSTEEASATAASLKVTAPERVRGGLLYQARLEIEANEAIGAPTLVFDKGWIEETTVNTLEPEPAETTTDLGHLKVRYAPLPPGRTLTVYISLQANPNDVGTHNADVALYDADEEIVSIDRTQVNFP
ncbi:MAG: hypothetical protein ACJ76D_12090 [Solirubrobacterales bacterium]